MSSEGRTAGDTVWSLVERRARLSGHEPLVTFVEDGRLLMQPAEAACCLEQRVIDVQGSAHMH